MRLREEVRALPAEQRVVIDEIQKAPQLFPAIKMSVDRDRRPGQFLLTGSANVLMLPQLSESLAGRMEIMTLRPLSQGELAGRRERFIDRLMEGKKWRSPAKPSTTTPSWPNGSVTPKWSSATLPFLKPPSSSIGSAHGPAT